MTWNWQQDDWRKFSYDKSKLQAFEEAFLRNCGEVIGTLKHLGDEEQSELRVTLLRDEAMQVVSGAVYAPTVHFEAPPSAQIFAELEAFIQWYNDAHEEKTIPPLTLAGIFHL